MTLPPCLHPRPSLFPFRFLFLLHPVPLSHLAWEKSHISRLIACQRKSSRPHVKDFTACISCLSCSQNCPLANALRTDSDASVLHICHKWTMTVLSQEGIIGLWQIAISSWSTSSFLCLCPFIPCLFCLCLLILCVCVCAHVHVCVLTAGGGQEKSEGHPPVHQSARHRWDQVRSLFLPLSFCHTHLLTHTHSSLTHSPT